ncbi:DUF202 domain-containing protein [Alcanivorax sp. S6407]|uniref:YidH family protein n=1 Tax=Alcanivorax sp. S6407 TaxID=2926424 RepID=UPI001FF6855F|nr:DUF202 domain-containing protein [Alcanivorax sp. S6407]MCK0154346.1 DUF202 domain-containing protein [Alcanivorax sp. S6407]
MSEEKDPRVLFAAERTLLAWNRTSIAMIAFGFLVERSGMLMRLLHSGPPDEVAQHITVLVGLLFIVVGAGVAIFASRQYARLLATLKPSDFPDGYAAHWGIAVNVVVALLGLVLAVALFLAR